MSEAMQLVTRVASDVAVASFALTVALFAVLVFRALVPKRRKAEPSDGTDGKGGGR